MKRALYLHRSQFTTGSIRQAESLMDQAGLTGQFTIFQNAEKMAKGLVSKRTKQGFTIDPTQRVIFANKLADTINKLKPSVIVINDDVALKALVGQNSCETCRGSTYILNGIPAIVIGGIHQIYFSSEFKFFLAQDISKIKRYVNGTLRNEPSFNYVVCDSIDMLVSASQYLDKCIFISVDIETAKTGITSISFTGVDHDGAVLTFVCPFVNPNTVDGCWWSSEDDEVRAWAIVTWILKNPIPKLFQNGPYDCAWFMLYGIPVNNYLLDTQWMWRSLWCEIRKALEVISSVVLDTYRYWKSEIKGETEFNEETKRKEPKDRVPKTPEKFHTYLRYNGLDSHYTALSGVFLIRLLAGKSNSWAMANYCNDFELQTGPYLAMSMRGVRCDTKRQFHYFEKWMQESSKNLTILREMADDTTFNPRSPLELGSLIYDVFGGRSPEARKKNKENNNNGKQNKSVDEKVLKFVKRQHPILDWIIQTVWDCKKPLNNASKYGQARLIGNNRFMYSLALLTETNRCSSSEHMFWVGSNIQNVPGKVRPMFVADPGNYMWEADYAQSDAYFVAFYCEDERMINNVLSEQDTHCLHGEFFFKHPYEKIYKSYKLKEDWAVHPLTGVRQVTKKTAHGANYRMAGMTLYIQAGHEMMQAAALELGHKDCYKWSARRWGQFCQNLIDRYTHELYPRLPQWFKETCDEAIRNKNRITVHGGFTRQFLGDLRKDQAAQREVSAFYGQGATAGKINRTIKRVWFETDLEASGGVPNSRDFHVNIQCHDSFTGNVIQNNAGLRKLDKFLTIMEEPVTILGRTFQVPVECDIGFGWKSGTIGYKPGTDHEELYQKVKISEDKFNAKHFGDSGSG